MTPGPRGPGFGLGPPPPHSLAAALEAAGVLYSRVDPAAARQFARVPDRSDQPAWHQPGYTPAAARAQVQKSVKTGGASGLSISRWVRWMPISPLAGSQ